MQIFFHFKNYYKKIFTKIKLFQSELVLFNLLIILFSLTEIIKKNNYIFFIFLIPAILLMIYAIHSWKWVIVIFGFLIIISLLLFFLNSNFSFHNLDHLFNFKNNPRLLMQQYIDNNYNDNVASCIKLLLFNEKNYETTIYQNIIKLNIVHLFVVSGVHLSALISLVNFLFKKWKWAKNIISILVALFLMYMTNFSISAIRIVLTLLLSLFLANKMNKLNIIILSAIIICLLAPNDAVSFGFILSYMSVIFILIINKIFDNQIIKIFIINIALSLASLPFNIYFNQAFNLFGWIYSFAFGPLIIFIYIISLFFCWIPFLFNVFEFIYINLIELIKNCVNNNHLIKMKIDKNILCLLNFIWCCLIDIYLFKNYQKPKKLNLNYFNNV